MTANGYKGKILRCNLSDHRISTEKLDEDFVKKWVGGVGLGVKYLYDEVKPGTAWSDPENRLIMSTGPLAASGVYGAGTFNIVSMGPMTGLAGSSQANGFFGAYLKLSGFDGIVVEGKSPYLVYLYIYDGIAEVRDAAYLAGKDVWEVEDAIREELKVGEKDVSVYGIGPAGENGVYYAAVVGDRGHVAAHNGLGAVMGSKNLKAVVVAKGKEKVLVFDSETLKSAKNTLFEGAKELGGGVPYKYGTGGTFPGLYSAGAIPVKNYTTNIYPAHEKMTGQYLREHYEIRPVPCYQCPYAHVKEVTVTEGPYKGFVGEEPEYEQIAAWGPQIGNDDLGATVMLGREVDRLGMDCNEASWAIGWTMECFEKGIFTTRETGGLNLAWGNVEAVRELLGRIARREGYLGNLLADGVKRASLQVGGEAVQWGIYTHKGSTPRSHDHRGMTRWPELFDTCVSDTGTLGSTWGGVHPQFVDLPPYANHFSHEEVAAQTAKFNGIRQFDDCLGTCRIVAPQPKQVLECFNAVTGWNWSLEDAFKAGLRIVNLLRIFNLRHGMNVQDEKPSARYGSVPHDGPAQGKDIMEKWSEMLKIYYRLMGWDENTGVPLPETLVALGLDDVIEDM